MYKKVELKNGFAGMEKDIAEMYGKKKTSLRKTLQ